MGNVKVGSLFAGAEFTTLATHRAGVVVHVGGEPDVDDWDTVDWVAVRFSDGEVKDLHPQVTVCAN